MLPIPYAWLAQETGPRLLVEALKFYGIQEGAGAKDNPELLRWAAELGGWEAEFYKEDSIPWCGLFVAHACLVAGLDRPKGFLRAKSWAEWGDATDAPMLGDVLVFTREGGGHVGIYVGEDDQAFHVLGGNQGDAVSIVRINKFRLAAARRTRWKIAQPKNVRPVMLSASGTISTNER